MEIFAFMLGIFGGALSVFILMYAKYKKARDWKSKQDVREFEIRQSLESLDKKKQLLDEQEKRIISYQELDSENATLKRDLQNVDVQLRKLELDNRNRDEIQTDLDQRIKDLGSKYLKDVTKWVGSSLTTNNFIKSKKRLQDIVSRVRKIGFEVSKQEEEELITNLKQEFEKKVRMEFERQEQTRIKAQIREEQRREKEIEKELQRLDREREAIKVALKKAIAEAKEEHSEEVERLKARLAEAEEKSKHAVSMAQLTKSGHVYVISNIGSFGEGVYKVGLTRRLEPMVRVRELGDASVPFPFDVHMMISSDDAPALETALHKALHKEKVNKINPRKEFFRSDIEVIREAVEKHHGKVDYVADPEALQYRQSLEMTDDDSEYIESVYESLEDEDAVDVDD